jgi:hypothetical protein
VATHPHHSRQDTDDIIHTIGSAARIVFAGLPQDEVELRNLKPVDAQKFDMKTDA